MDFFDRIKTLVKEKNITIEYLLTKAFPSDSITRNVYNGWRSRGNLPRADQALKLANVLNVSVEYLVTGMEPRYKGMSELRQEFHRWIDNLDETELDDLNRFLDLLESGVILTSLKRKK